MLFPTHLVAGALLARWSNLPVAAVVAGTIIPDLVDKPLGSLGVTNYFHTVGHSGLIVLLFVPLAFYGRTGLAVWVGWVSHLALDAAHIVINGRPADTQFLLWPLLHPTGQVQLPPGEFALFYLWSPSFFVEVGIWLVFLGVLVETYTEIRLWPRSEES